MKVSSHIVAVALKNGRLDEYLAWHLRNNPMPNMTTLAGVAFQRRELPAKREGVSRKVSTKLQRLPLKPMNQLGLSGSH